MQARRKRGIKNRVKKTTDQIINWFIFQKLLRLHEI